MFQQHILMNSVNSMKRQRFVQISTGTPSEEFLHRWDSKINTYLKQQRSVKVSWYIVVCITTSYGLDGPGIESR